MIRMTQDQGCIKGSGKRSKALGREKRNSSSCEAGGLPSVMDKERNESFLLGKNFLMLLHVSVTDGRDGHHKRSPPRCEG